MAITFNVQRMLTLAGNWSKPTAGPVETDRELRSRLEPGSGTDTGRYSPNGTKIHPISLDPEIGGDSLEWRPLTGKQGREFRKRVFSQSQ